MERYMLKITVLILAVFVALLGGYVGAPAWSRWVAVVVAVGAFALLKVSRTPDKNNGHTYDFN